LRLSVEKNGSLTAVLLCAHKRSVTRTVAKEKSKMMLDKRDGNSASVLHGDLMQKVMSSDHSVERGDREPRDTKCFRLESDHRNSVD
jgi:hypothetical protein